MFSLALLLWRDTARVIRSQVLVVRERSFIEAARVSGASDWRIMLVHIMPNILPLSFLYGSLAVGWAILTEASVSFLGFGDPKTISWGYMLHDAYVFSSSFKRLLAWFIPLVFCIMLMVMAGFYIGRGSEEILYPRLRKFQRIIYNVLSLLEILDLKIYYRSSSGISQAVDGISFYFRERTSLGLVGESG